MMTRKKNRESSQRDFSQRDFSQKDFSQSEVSFNDFSQSSSMNMYSSDNYKEKKSKSKFKLFGGDRSKRYFFGKSNHDNERNIPRDVGTNEKKFFQFTKKKDKNRNKPLPVINEKMQYEAMIEQEESFSQPYFQKDQSQLVNEDVLFFSQTDENTNPNLRNNLYQYKKGSNPNVRNNDGSKFENFINSDLPNGNGNVPNVNKLKSPDLIKSIVNHEDNFTDTSTAVSSNILNGSTLVSVSTSTTENSNVLNGSTLVNGNNKNLGNNSAKDENVNFFLDKSVFEDPSHKEPKSVNNPAPSIKSLMDLTNYSQNNFADTSFIDSTIFSNSNFTNSLIDNSFIRTN